MFIWISSGGSGGTPLLIEASLSSMKLITPLFWGSFSSGVPDSCGKSSSTRSWDIVFCAAISSIADAADALSLVLACGSTALLPSGVLAFE